MKNEVEAAVKFISSYLMNPNIEEDHVDTVRSNTIYPNFVYSFQSCLRNLLLNKFKSHWYPGDAQRGQGYRCIGIDKSKPMLDPILAEALQRTGLIYPRENWPEEMIVWIDPDEVTYTIVVPRRGDRPRRRISKKIYPDLNAVTCANKVLKAVPWVFSTDRPNLNVPPPTFSLPVHMNETANTRT